MAVHTDWFAVRVRSNFERIVADALQGKGYERFLPAYRCKRRWSDRIREVDLPLFPGYVFARFAVEKRLPILMTTGVIEVVGYGKTPVPVDPAEIEALQRVVEARLGAEPCPYLRVGQRVRVDRGALAGVEGVLTSIKKSQRLVLAVTLLQRAVAVEIDESSVAALDDAMLVPEAMRA
ncbi:MAG: UpxY family transcription antiterminator [Vicinamibacterales bacterium]